MANPILHRNDAFTARAPQGQMPYQGYGQQPWQGGQFAPQQPYGQVPPASQNRAGQFEPTMTLDDVIAKTGITMLTLMVAAALTYVGIGTLDYAQQFSTSSAAVVVSGLVGFVTVLLVAARKRINPALVLFYSVVEGVFIGAFSLMFQNLYDGIVGQAVLGTFAAAGCTLAAYKFFNIRVSDRMRRMVFIGTAAFAGVMLVNFVLSLLGLNMGLRTGAMGFVAALLGVGLAVFNLIVDFDDVERGIAANAPASESWRAAFGLTVTMVWLYTEILRLLSYFRR